ncbi:hypothetical protein [Pseudomonas tohonis]|uniref:hypothetical protein n=1 Tax=Pseudomonas tohonis TaxID=2725477 RepID=UPI001F218D35|nr:hypothetical protein [Pseudomonas tohonis]
MNKWIIIDKSYLQGAPALRISKLSSELGLLMTDALLYELVKNPEKRAKLFSKFPHKPRPFELVPNLGYFLRHEAQENNSCGLPSNHIRRIDHSQTENYKDPKFSLTNDLIAHLSQKKNEIDEDSKQLVATIASIESVFPELTGTPKKDRIPKAQYIKNKIFSNDQLVQQGANFLISNSPFFQGGLVNTTPAWMTYRWLQVQLLFALDYWSKHPDGVRTNGRPEFEERIRHDILDAIYITIALQEGAFATKEKKLIDWWKKLSPDSLLVTS